MTASIHAVSVDGADEYGNPVLVETVSNVRCHARQLTASETGDNIDKQTWRMIAGPDVVVSTHDRVTVAGTKFEIVGEPSERYNPRTRIVEGITFDMVVTA